MTKAQLEAKVATLQQELSSAKEELGRIAKERHALANKVQALLGAQEDYKHDVRRLIDAAMPLAKMADESDLRFPEVVICCREDNYITYGDLSLAKSVVSSLSIK